MVGRERATIFNKREKFCEILMKYAESVLKILQIFCIYRFSRFVSMDFLTEEGTLGASSVFEN